MAAPPFRVVIAGRPNVGKSVLFNRLLKRRRSLVHDLPGMTRDVLEADAALPDGRGYRLYDTGGFDPSGREAVSAAVRRKALEAMRSADLLLLVYDASAGILADDRAAADAARKAGADTIVVANKIDRKDAAAGELEAWELGFGEVLGVSAEHGIGVDDLQIEIGTRLAQHDEAHPKSSPEREAEPELAVAVVGRPNVGKSSLVNALLGSERTIVSEAPGTTRDAVDAVLERGGRRFRIIDTAGIRRRSKTERGPEVLSVVQARQRIERCDVAVLVLDAADGPTSQDATVASYADDAGKGLVIVANKWDLAGREGEPGEKAAREMRRAVEERVPFARHAPVLLVSARTGRGVSRVLETAARVAENRRRRIPTAQLNRVLGAALRDRAARSVSSRELKILYVAQTGVEPPTFSLVASREEPLHFSERRRIENRLREAADFGGSPIRISVRGRSKAPARSARGGRRRRTPAR